MSDGFRHTFSPQMYHASVWVPDGAECLKLHTHYISGPQPGEDRDEWLEALHSYRRDIREGSGNAVARLAPSTGTWILMDPALCKAYDLYPGEKFHVLADGRLLSGSGEVRLCFNIYHRKELTWADWPMQAGAACSFVKTGEWEVISGDVTVPVFDRTKYMVYPMIGVGEGTIEIRNVELRVDDPPRMSEVEKVLASVPEGRALDLGSYDRDDLKWASRTYSSQKAFIYDLSFHDPKSGYRLDEYLDEGEREFGGYEAILLWHAYPRIGVDDRNQFDFYRDMPGGLAGVRDLCRRAHARGVKVLINYNPWDTGTRREEKSDEVCLADILAEIEGDGIFLDTMGGGSPYLREQVDLRRAGVVFEPEGHPDIHQLGICNSSWGQYLTDPEPPGLLHLKWIEPRHMQRQIRRWEKSHRDEIETTFFNGSGMLIWENVFGTYNPWSDNDRALWRRAVPILRRFSDLLTSDAWDPFYPTRAEGLFANHWSADGVDIFTLLNRGAAVSDAPLVALPHRIDMAYYDLWRGTPLETRIEDGRIVLLGSADRIGCLLAVRNDLVDEALLRLLARQHETQPVGTPARNHAASVVEPLPVAPTERSAQAPRGMVRVEGSTFQMRIRHEARECNCYPDPGTPPERWPEFLERAPAENWMHHDIGPLTLPTFHIDEAQVTNREFAEFLKDSGYSPRHRENFLKHWPGGKMPEALADHPVVYVDLDDARAYARWAGKRLLTEPEWHLAAQGTDGRKWPWGNDFDPARCNTLGSGTVPARSFPEGRSPWGCYGMSGNVWEWTESERSDGHTRFAIIRGGSWFKAEGSVWYVSGGPQPCDFHAKFLLMWPGLDRCATIGFRCAKDAQ